MPLQQWKRSLGTFQRGTVSNGTKAHVLMIPAHISMKSLLQSETEAHPNHQVIEGVPRHVTKERRNRFVSFGNKVGAHEAKNAGSVMKANRPDLHVLQLLPGHLRMTPRDHGERTAGAPAVERIDRPERRDPEAQREVAPQRGTRPRLMLPRHHLPPFA